MRRFATAVVAALLLAFSRAASVGSEQPEMAGSEPDAVVASASWTMETVVSRDTVISPRARELLHRARGILIVSQPVQGKFMLSQGGAAVLLTRSSDNNWSYPAFYTVDAGQVGDYVTALVLIIMSERALQAVMRDKFKVGEDPDITVAELGADGIGATADRPASDIYGLMQVQAAGVFFGIKPEGCVIRPWPGYNEAYYGAATRLSDILRRGTVSNRNAEPLRAILRQASTSR